MAMAQKGAALHSGHRERLRKKVLEHGIDVLESHEVLELLLFYSIPRRNTNGIAHEMLDEFETLPGVLEAAKGPLEQISGVSEKTIFLFRYLDEFWNLLEDPNRRPPPIKLNTVERWTGYFQRLLYQQTSNLVLLAYLDQSCCLLGQQVIWEGKGVPFKEKQGDYRNLIRQALVKNAAYALLVRHQARSTAVILPQDRELVQALQATLNNLGVVLMDYLILGAHFSSCSVLLSQDGALLQEV
ncbi:MAG TPA: hypothetical protein IAD19_08610 [Candidatus Egerieicola faecale]|uniref:RadC-like JAB domain-containing protein n=1 Tax=Candidatus Egerieicola faecale TaxID=2840774 RepID=A0A9D1IS74_9FIRM|nr:hypothetical protein [Candidatus Egerieicola faecale]